MESNKSDATGYRPDWDPREGMAPVCIDERAKMKALSADWSAEKQQQFNARWNGGAVAGMPAPRTFGSGATRNSDEGKYDYEGFISPLVLNRYARYMHLHRKMEDGKLRDSDNWQKGIPRAQYLKSMLRHVMDVWLIMRNKAGFAVERSLEEALCAVKFNVDGLLHEVLSMRDTGAPSYSRQAGQQASNTLQQAGNSLLGIGLANAAQGVGW